MRRIVRVLAALLLLGALPLLTGAGGGRSYVAGKFALDLDGVMAGYLSSAEGGAATADVINEAMGPDFIIHKHIGQPKYEDITITVGTGMTKGFYDWIQASFTQAHQRRSGAIIAMDFQGREISRQEFQNALITEVGMPALDAASKDAAKMTIKFAPEYTRYKKGSGSAVKAPSRQQKLWLPANFRLRIDGLEAATSRVNKIEAIVVKQKVVENPVGDQRDYEKEPAKVEIPNLVITTAESHAQTLYDWHEDFVVMGNNGQEQEKTGSLVFLASDSKTELFQLDLHHLGLFRLTAEEGGEGIRRLKAEMYCEEMTFSYSAAATGI